MERQSVTMWTLHGYRVHIVRLLEFHLSDSESRCTTVPMTDTVYWLHHNGSTDNSGLQGVAVDLTKKFNDALISWEPVSSELVLAHFKPSPALSRS